MSIVLVVAGNSQGRLEGLVCLRVLAQTQLRIPDQIEALPLGGWIRSGAVSCRERRRRFGELLQAQPRKPTLVEGWEQESGLFTYREFGGSRERLRRGFIFAQVAQDFALGVGRGSGKVVVASDLVAEFLEAAECVRIVALAL